MKNKQVNSKAFNMRRKIADILIDCEALTKEETKKELQDAQCKQTKLLDKGK